MHAVQEGLFLYSHNVSPYDGGVFHQVSLHPTDLRPDGTDTDRKGPSTSPSLQTHPSLLLLRRDQDPLHIHRPPLRPCLDAHSRLRAIRFFKTVHISTKRHKMGWSSRCFSVGQKKTPTEKKCLTQSNRFLFNPLTIKTCIGRPTSVFSNCAILFAVANAVSDKPMSAMLALSLASYFSMYPALLLAPLILLCYDRQVQSGKGSSALAYTLNHVAIFAAGLIWLLYISYILTGGSWEFMSSTYGVQLLMPDLTPNVGLWWYFFIEMFDSFREFFLGVFWLHLGGYVGGLCIRLRTQPLFVITTMLGIFAIFKPYPSVSDTSLYFAMLPLYRHVFPRKSTFLPSRLLTDAPQSFATPSSPSPPSSTRPSLARPSTTSGSTPARATPTSSTPSP